MTGYYELKRSGSTEFMFNLKAGNHETILTSQRYSSKDGAQHGIASVQENSPQADKYDRRVSKDESPYFVLTAGNGLVIGTSEMYSSTSARDQGIASVVTNGPTKIIKEIE